MDNFKNKLYRFMYGRYGHDQLGTFLLCIGAILLVVNSLFIDNAFLSYLVWVLLIWNLYRTYSKKIYARRKENDTYLRISKPYRKRYQVFKKQRGDKNHKYFLCPSCLQITRVPVGRGKVTITCPACKTKFDRKC